MFSRFASSASANAFRGSVRAGAGSFRRMTNSARTSLTTGRTVPATLAGAAGVLGLWAWASDMPLTAAAETLSNSKHSGEKIENIDDILEKYIPAEELKEVKRILYGYNDNDIVKSIPITPKAAKMAQDHDFEIKAYDFKAGREEGNEPRVVRIGMIQTGIVKPTKAPVKEQYEAIKERTGRLIDAAGEMGVNVICLQECWHMPFAFATREKAPWGEFAQDAEFGDSTKWLSEKAKKYNMVIVSPIFERDDKHQGIFANTAVIIGNNGNYIGKHRKNHIPRVGDFNESTYYFEGDTGHPVFETAFGRIGVNICYGRHHPLNWMAFGLNGAEIVFNPSATVGALSEPMWSIEQRNAAIANNYFVGAINRVGTEVFPNEFTSANGKPAHRDFGHFYGSTYMSGPDASRCPGLSRTRDGLLITDVDLNLNQQVKDKWTFQMTARYPMYAEFLNKYIQQEYEPQRIRDPSLDRKPKAPQ